MRSQHPEKHRSIRIGWLRAAVLGANDGIVSVASLVVGVATAGSSRAAILLTGVAGLVAGAMSMAAGEYVSVSSQADTEAADLALERRELRQNPGRELDELTAIYVDRGLDHALARQVAEQLTARGDALAVHAREELGITEAQRARPLQAAAASAASFGAGALLPVLAVLLGPPTAVPLTVGVSTVVALAILGVVAARAGGAPVLPSTLRVTGWGLAAVALTAAVGELFGVAP